jgi:hypothetical protein
VPRQSHVLRLIRASHRQLESRTTDAARVADSPSVLCTPIALRMGTLRTTLAALLKEARTLRAGAPIVCRLVSRIGEETSRVMSSLNWFRVLIALILILLFALAGLLWPELQ